MKKLGYFTAIILVGAAMTFTTCKKKRIDPCENVVCEDYEKCVDGKCVTIRKK